jgi:hypothetical protein
MVNWNELDWILFVRLKSMGWIRLHWFRLRLARIYWIQLYYNGLDWGQFELDWIRSDLVNNDRCKSVSLEYLSSDQKLLHHNVEL